MPLQQNRIFLKAAARDFKRTGAIAPSSTALGQAMTSQMTRTNRSPIRVLEVGGGIGSITRVIGKAICRGDHLDVYEIDPTFAAVIEDRLKWDKGFQGISATVSVHNQPIESVDRCSRYDFIISCLPFTNFEPGAVRKIFEIYRELLNPDGVCSFFEYALIRNAKRLIWGSSAERKRAAAVSEVVRSYVDQFSFRRDLVLMNLPPAIVHHIRFAPASFS